MENEVSVRTENAGSNVAQLMKLLVDCLVIYIMAQHPDLVEEVANGSSELGGRPHTDGKRGSCVSSQ